MSDQIQKPERALLVGAFKGGALERPIAEEHLEELELLVDTYGVESVGTVLCPVKKFDAAILIGKGKLEEIVLQARVEEVDLIIFDDELSPAQQRNLEKHFDGTLVLDRTEVILGVFAQRAQTKEARLQVELAQVRYEAPRLKRLWTHLERQAGTGNAGAGRFLKGMGEKQIEVDKRLLRKRILRLQNELKEVRLHRGTQRHQRQRGEVPVFALVGYTNAGKSTLLNALTDSDAMVEDKLFATLDTTTRKMQLPNNQKVLVIDTVGFIRKLPHQLIAAFKSTLEEAVFADILLHVIDASHPQALEQGETTLEVLEELGASDRPVITVLNKVDQVSDQATLRRFQVKFSKTVMISAKTGEGIDLLQERMVTELMSQRRTLRLRIPQSEYAVIGPLMENGNVLHQDYEENDVLLHIDLPAAYVGRLEKYIEEIDQTRSLDA